MIKKYMPNTRFHPEHKTVSVQYTVEYTELDEDINGDFSNLKKIQCEDLAKAIARIFQLRQLEKHNISLYYCIADSKASTTWLMEDYAHDLEQYADTKRTAKILQERQELVTRMQETREELELYKKFVREYKGEELFQTFRKQQTIVTN